MTKCLWNELGLSFKLYFVQILITDIYSEGILDILLN